MERTVKPLPADTWVVMVHHNFAERVIGHLAPRQPVVKLPTLAANNAKMPKNKKRQAFHDYELLLAFQVTRPPSSDLSPFARQNISWTSSMQYTMTLQRRPPEQQTPKGHLPRSICQTLAKVLYETCQLDALVTTVATVPPRKLRVDVYPRYMLEPLCHALQQVAASNNKDNDSRDAPRSDDPFEGNLPMTASLSACSVRLTVVVVTTNNRADDDTDNNTTTFCWGKDGRPHDNHRMDKVRLNHQATEEIQIVPMAAPDGSEPLPTPAATTPLSRAYYKLHQVVTTNHIVFLTDTIRETLRGTHGVDIGASPGGWTQVLLHELHMQHVWAMDKAKLAQRIATTAARVTHVPCRLQDCTAAQISTLPPLSVVVSDASVSWKTLWDDMAKHFLPHVVRWQFPTLLVWTCKLPFDRPNNIIKQVTAMQEALPEFLEQIRPFFVESNRSDAPIDLHMESQLVHLFANSPSERTLVVLVVEQKDAKKGAS